VADAQKSKLGAASRHRLAQLRASGDTAPPRLAIFLRGAGQFTPEQLDQLEKDGATIRTRAGSVVTVDLPLADVERVLEHDFIVAADLSSPLYPESGDRTPR